MQTDRGVALLVAYLHQIRGFLQGSRPTRIFPLPILKESFGPKPFPRRTGCLTFPRHYSRPIPVDLDVFPAALLPGKAGREQEDPQVYKQGGSIPERGRGPVLAKLQEGRGGGGELQTSATIIHAKAIRAVARLLGKCIPDAKAGSRPAPFVFAL